MELIFLTCLFVLMVSSNALTFIQPEWRCSFNMSHPCRHEPQWIPMTETIEGMANKTNGYVVANINNASTTSEAVIDVSHIFLSNRGTINIWYRSKTAEPFEREGTLNITACKSQPEPIFSVGHHNCSNWCMDIITYTCDSRSDVKVVFTATRGSVNTEIAIDLIYITPTPDWEFSSRDGFNESSIEQSDTDSNVWMTEELGYLHAVFDQEEAGDTAVFSVKHQFTSSSGNMQLQYFSYFDVDDAFLNVSACFDNETALSVSPPIMPMDNRVLTSSHMQYDCGCADDVFFTFTAIRGLSNMSNAWIGIDGIRIFEGDSSRKTESSTMTMMTTTKTTTTVTNSDDQNVVITEIFTDTTNIEATTSLTTEATTALGNSSNDTSGSTTNRTIIPIVVAAVIILVIVFVIVGVVRCVLLRRRRKSERRSLIAPRSNSQNVYMNPAFVAKPTTPGVSHQPDLLDGLNAAPIVVSQETQDSRTEPPQVATGSTKAVAQNADRYYSIHGLPDGGEGEDPDSHDYSLPDETRNDHASANAGPSKSNNKNIANASAGYASLKRSDDLGSHYYSLPEGIRNDPSSAKPGPSRNENIASSDASAGYASLKKSDDPGSHDYSLPEGTRNNPSSAKPGPSRNENIASNDASAGYASLKRNDDPDSHDYSLPYEADNGYSRINPRPIKTSTNNTNPDDASPGYTSLKRNDNNFEGPDYSLLNATHNDPSVVNPPSKTSSTIIIADDASPEYATQKKPSGDLALDHTPLTKTTGGVRDSISNHYYHSLDEDQSNGYARLDDTQHQDTSSSDRVVGSDGEYGQLGTPTSAAVMYDDDDYNRLAHKDHHHLLVDKARPGNYGNKHEKRSSTARGELHSPELFNDNVYNTFNDCAAQSRDGVGHYESITNENQATETATHPPNSTGRRKEGTNTQDITVDPTSLGRQESVNEYESVDFKHDESGSAVPETNETQHGTLIDHDGDPLDDDYEEPLQPNTSKGHNHMGKGDADEEPKNKGTNLAAGNQDAKPHRHVNDQVSTVRPPGAGDYQSLKLGKKVKKNRKDGAGSDDHGLGEEGAQNIPQVIQDHETQQIPLDRDLDAYGPKSNGFDRISPLYHSIKIGKK